MKGGGIDAWSRIGGRKKRARNYLLPRKWNFNNISGKEVRDEI
jgi:hypothetical protein